MFSGNKKFTQSNIIEEFVYWSHWIWLYMLMKYNRLLKMFTKIMGIYECSLSWCFFWSCVRDFLIWKMCSFTKLKCAASKFNQELREHSILKQHACKNAKIKYKDKKPVQNSLTNWLHIIKIFTTKKFLFMKHYILFSKKSTCQISCKNIWL